MTDINHLDQQELSVSEAHLEALHAELVRSADSNDLLDVAYRTLDSPIGRLLLAATGRGLVRIAFEREGFGAVLDGLAAKVSSRILLAPRRLDKAARELDEYFAGGRRRFDLPLDRTLSSGFRATVQGHLPSIEYGRTATYQQVAHAVGNQRAFRAVGAACATNPLPIVVPCHRVLRSDGRLGGYLGGLAAKAELLTMEHRVGPAGKPGTMAGSLDQGAPPMGYGS